MANAPVPRRSRFPRTLVSYNSRLRRLEVNSKPTTTGSGVACGVAQYSTDFSSDAASADVTLNLIEMSSSFDTPDTIGCTPVHTGLEIPPGWMWWANVSFFITPSGTVATGELLMSSFRNRAGGFYVVRSEPMLADGVQPITHVLFGTSGFAPIGDPQDGVFSGGDIATNLGTEFTIGEFTITVMAISTFDCFYGIPGDD